MAMTDPICARCFGIGWWAEVVPGTENDYIPDYRERYCDDCPAGDRLRRHDGAPPYAGGSEG